MPWTSAKSCFSQKCPADEGFLRSPLISLAEPESSLYQGDHERLARDWAFNIYLSFFTAWIVSISLILFTLYFMHNGCFLYRDDLAEGTSILKWITRLLQFGQGCKCLVLHVTKWRTSPMPLFHELMAAFLFCDIPACWNSYLEEQMLKIKIFLSQASSLAACLARLYLIIFCWCVAVKRKPRRKIGN